jgi:rare lipoprotein A
MRFTLTIILTFMAPLTAGLADLRPVPCRVPRVESGQASWYGPGFHGRLTASGEVYDMYDLTAAHPALPFGTTLRVTDLVSGRSVIVRINDRGPFIGRRVLDLSYAAADRLGIVHDGLTQVRMEPLEQFPL